MVPSRGTGTERNHFKEPQGFSVGRTDSFNSKSSGGFVWWGPGGGQREEPWGSEREEMGQQARSGGGADSQTSPCPHAALFSAGRKGEVESWKGRKKLKVGSRGSLSGWEKCESVGM